MNQFPNNVNPLHNDTLPSNIIQNPNNDGHCMVITTQRDKNNNDPHILFVVEDDI